MYLVYICMPQIHTDLAGLIEPVGINGHRYAITFTDDFSGAIFVYFLKTKKDTVSATKKFIADTAPPPWKDKIPKI